MFRLNELKSYLILALTISLFIALLFLFNIYLSGVDAIPDVIFERMGKAVTMGFVMSFVYIFIASRIIRLLNAKKILRNNWRRWGIEAITILSVALAVSAVMYRFSPPPPDTPDGMQAFFRPIVMFSFINLLFGAIIFAVTEAWNINQENRDLQLSLANTEKEKVSLQLAALQQKINPHFLFNSLSVLSELTYEDPGKANDFIREFAKIYRYVLEVNEEVVVTVKQEIEFLKAYLFLQKIRFGESLVIEQDIDPGILGHHIPPLSLQLLFENAIKHNQISKTAPLHIQLENSNGHLMVTNNLQVRNDIPDSNGVGLSSLKKTYQLISDDVPAFHQTQDHFIAKIPLIT